MKIAYVLYPDFTALDLVGPYEVISRWPGAEVHFVARTLDPVRCDCGLTVIPTDTPQTLPDPDLIVVPGSGNPVPVLSDEVLIASTLRLALRALLGDRAVQMATRMNRQAAAARLARARKALTQRRMKRGQPPPRVPADPARRAGDCHRRRVRPPLATPSS